MCYRYVFGHGIAHQKGVQYTLEIFTKFSSDQVDTIASNLVHRVELQKLHVGRNVLIIHRKTSITISLEKLRS